MKYKVVRPFLDGEVYRNIGDILTLNNNKASKLLKYRLVCIYKEEKEEVVEEKIETAVKKEVKKQNTSKKKGGK